MKLNFDTSHDPLIWVGLKIFLGILPQLKFDV